MDELEYPELLNDILKLMSIVLRVRTESQQDAVECDLLSIVALNINMYGLRFVNIKTIEVLQELKNVLVEKQLKIKVISMIKYQPSL